MLDQTKINIEQKNGSVEINFPQDMPADAISAQVDSCQAETCDCCTPQFRENVEDFSKVATDAGIKVVIRGDISAEQVRENVLACAPKLKN